MTELETELTGALGSGVEYMNALNKHVVEYLTGKMGRDDFVNACIELSDGQRRREWAGTINAALRKARGEQ